jgi:hypothetical protein
LIEQRAHLVDKTAEIQKTIDLVDHKLEVYEHMLLEKEKEIVGIAD